LAGLVGLVALAALGLAACGGGSGSDGGTGGTGGDSTPTVPLPPLGAGESAYDDLAAYSSQRNASLPGATEGAAVTRHTLVLGGTPIAYTATAGHLIARDPASGAAEASVFYVAYTADGADPATRPVTFFYNGGPGSASVWLHLGSFGPKRLVTGVPATTAATPFPLVDNSESLLDVTDLVFIDAVGTGLSEAISPFTNISFWGVDSDAALFRDFIERWLAANGRGSSPRFLYGESYGGPRTAVLAGRLQDAGVLLDGLVLQSPALDYNSNCGIAGVGHCGANLPTYAAIGAFHGLSNPVPTDIDADMAELRSFTDSRYTPAVVAFLGGAAVPADLPPLLAGYTGIAAPTWSAQFNFPPDAFQFDLIANTVTGRYDGRMVAPLGSALASESDPSSTFITPSFTSVMASYLHDTLRYSNASTYVVTSSAINDWDFSHAGRPLPDTVPDLQAALAQNTVLRVLSVNGYHDLATPFHVTESDLARLGGDPRVQVRDYPGGHMSYLTDSTRVRQKADLAAFYAGTLALRAAASQAPARALALNPRPRTDSAGTPPTTRQPVVAQPAVQTPLRDPWVPPRVRARAQAEAGAQRNAN
jgi:carboxypeptidase C (cathepsin A)